MMKIALKILLILIIFGCNTSNQLINEWVVVDKDISINEDWKYLLELDSILILNKFDKAFPNKLNKGDQISITRDRIKNKDKEYSYYYSDSTLNIRHADVVYSLKYEKEKNVITVFRELHQGRIKWTLKKNER